MPASALAELPGTPLSIYLHVPFCATRCGYCDFNTYTSNELQGTGTADYLRAAHAEIELARRVLGDDLPRASTVFFGGGTPTMLSGGELGGLLGHVRDAFGLAPDAEVTTEANPETVTPHLLDELLTAGFTRISLGMQSSDAGVLKVLERRHTPGRAVEAARLAHTAGFGDVSLDLIYGTPGESQDAWRASLEAALEAEPEHISAYALIVEDGTRLANQIRRGQLPMTDDDDLADKYLLTEQVLTGAGFEAYEVSNWSRGSQHRARHNMAYWLGHTWWGIGPGAHSHAGGVRWWNVKHPRTYAAALDSGRSPGAGRELVAAEDRRVERVLLELRLADGLLWEVLTDSELRRVPDFVERGLARITQDRLVLTLQGRLLADAVIRDLLD
ncbi:MULTISPECIES: radical SAM family heme chaperone HemW [unclassified Luteococcus]|uniref:radical SAM family heme chaperone HemW n=1 Tax=unclassified Luteococcus TaxID=2639923 RepID=UPI00313D6113